MQQPNDLTKEQIEQLKKFAELPPEKKAELLEKQCIFCQIVKGNVDTIKVYEDKKLLAVLDINPANPGHVLIFPKQHFQLLFQLPDDVREKMFDILSKLSIYLVNTVKAKGINFYAANGLAAGQRVPHFVFNLIPRYEGDGISFGWEPKKANKGELQKIANTLKKSFDKSKEEEVKGKDYRKKIEKEIERELKKFKRRA